MALENAIHCITTGAEERAGLGWGKDVLLDRRHGESFACSLAQVGPMRLKDRGKLIGNVDG